MDKKDYRAFMRKHRRDFVLSYPARIEEANARITQHALKEIQNLIPNINEGVIGAYWTMGNEVDVIPLLYQLAEEGRQLALPKSIPGETILNFCEWNPGCTMEESDLGFSYPASATCFLMPNLILVPLVAFDRRGYRLGYGKGLYDRTWEILRLKNPNLKTLGVAYSIQCVERLPVEPHDMRLDAVITEEGAVWFSL